MATIIKLNKTTLYELICYEKYFQYGLMFMLSWLRIVTYWSDSKVTNKLVIGYYLSFKQLG